MTTRSVRARVASAVAVTALAASALATAGSAASAPARTPAGAPAAAPGAVVPSVPGCRLEASTIEPDADLTQQVFDSSDYGKAPYQERLYTAPAQVSAMAGVSAQWDAVYYPSRYLYYRQFAVRTDRLVFGTTHYNTVKQTKAYTEKKFGTGWGSVTKMVDASDRNPELTKSGYLYAVSGRTGNLARYKVSEKTWGSPSVAAAGAKAGFGGVTAMTLAYQYRAWDDATAVDALLMTTKKGALYLVTMKRSGAFAPRLTLLRGSTWSFDGLALNNCGPRSWILLATNSSSDVARVYEVFPYRGTSTTINQLGKVPGAWDARFTASYWESDIPVLQP
ncbi:hypothetical protein GCM10025782_24390 [Pedococcus ginsenosidimutans]|uniref:DUF4185 domain-containing protein n=1 Tax=Pedococcus ginsenosidimutans TaxID=490570 RepID=A0ABP8YEI7_9MICO